jgi:hypothetical protein
MLRKGKGSSEHSAKRLLEVTRFVLLTKPIGANTTPHFPVLRCASTANRTRGPTPTCVATAVS